MISKKTIEEILRLAVCAPSGDNAQPWRFTVQGDTIKIFNLPEKDKSLYNFLQRGSFVAHGALLENISIISHTKGYGMSTSLFPEKNNANFIASVTFVESNSEKDPLYDSISLRATNRKAYKKTPLLLGHKQEILRIPQEIGVGRLRLIEELSEKNRLAKSLSINERLLLENEHIHHTLFSNIRWTEKEERIKKTGLYLETLELSPPQKLAFMMFKNWRLVQILNIFGLSKFLAKEGAKLNDSTGALGIITMPNDSPEHFIATGKMLQRIWLKATKMGLCLQPLGAIPYLAQRVFSGDTRLSPRHREIIKEIYNEAKQTFGLTNEIITMIFRIGYNGEPSAHSSRLPPDISFSSS